MTRVATQRLIDASANLGAGDRALLNLLVHHGIDDVALGRLLRISEPDAAARRDSLAERLGEELGLPPSDVHRALDELMEAAHDPAEASEAAAGDPRGTRALAPSAENAGPARRRGVLRAAVVVLIVAVVIVIVALASSGSTPHRTGARSPSHPQIERQLPLTALPGQVPAARARLVLTGGARPKLTASVTGLRPAGSGHYELWLYNSIIDAQPLASLGRSGGTVTIALPPGYRRYRWLDVSEQTSGATYDSGESVLRAVLTG